MYKVFIIQLTRMGDIIQTLPLLKRLHEVHSDLQITFLCVSEFSDIIRYVPLIHRYIKIPASEAVALKKNPGNLENFLQTHPFMQEEYNLVVNLTHDFESGRMSAFMKADKKAGLVCESDEDRYIPDSWGRYLFSVVRNRVENTFNLVDIHVGMGGVSHKPVANFLTIPDRIKKNMKLWRLNKPDFSGRFLVVFHIGASRLQRTWPVESYVELGEMLVRKMNVAIVLTGKGRAEREASETFLRFWAARNLPSGVVVNMVDRLSLHNLVALISVADLLISGDTGPLHIAAAVGTRTIGLYIATAYPGETAPYGYGHTVVCPDIDCYPCMGKTKFGECGIKCRNYIKPYHIYKLIEKIFNNHDICFSHDGVNIYHSSFLTNGTLFYEPFGEKEYSKVFIQQVVNRFMWDAILGVESDFAMRRLVDEKQLLEEAKELLGKLVEARGDCISVVRKLNSAAINSHYIYDEIFSSRFQGLLKYYFSLIPPNPLKSQKDMLALWRNRLNDIEHAIYRLKDLLA